MQLFHVFNTLTNTRGDSLLGYQVRLLDTATKAVEPIFGDAGGTPIFATSGIIDVAVTDAAGVYNFFVAPGTYDIQFLTPAGVFIRSIINVPMTDGTIPQAAIDAAAAAAAAAVEDALDGDVVASQAAATLAAAWAESPTSPIGAGTKSAKTWAGEASASAAIAAPYDQSLLPFQDLFRPDRVKVGAPEAGVILTGGIYDDFRYLILPAKALTLFQVNKPLGSASGFNRVEFYSSSTITVGGYLGAWTDSAQTPIFTNLSPLSGSQIVVLRFGLNRIIGSDSYAVSIDADFKILPPNTGSDKPRGWGRFISKPDVQPMLNETIAWVGDSRFKNGNYNTPKRITVELGMTMMLTDANGKSDVAKSGRTMDKALYRADDVTAITASEVQALTQVAIDFGYNDLFKTNPGVPTAANIAARIGAFTDAASGTVTPAGVASAATMCGKARTIIAWLLAQNPRLKITWSSTYYGNDPVGTLGLTQGQIEQWLLAWRDELERLCAVMGVGFHDWMKTSGINRYNYATYLEDQIHMTDTPSDRNSATPSGYDLGMVSQWVQHYRAHGMPKRALAAYENVP